MKLNDSFFYLNFSHCFIKINPSFLEQNLDRFERLKWAISECTHYTNFLNYINNTYDMTFLWFGLAGWNVVKWTNERLEPGYALIWLHALIWSNWLQPQVVSISPLGGSAVCTDLCQCRAHCRRPLPAPTATAHI